MSVKSVQVTKQWLRERLVIEGLRGIDDDFEEGSICGLLLDKRVKAFNPNASREDRDRIKENCRQELKLNRIKKATQDADGASRRLEAAHAKLREDRAKQEKAVSSRRRKRNSKNYGAIDSMLREIAEAQPENHKEVFEQLDSRRIRVPKAEPFVSAGGWIAGFQRNAPLARAWLSKRWSLLSLPPFPRGPK